jgi:hypothetical protein
MRCPLAQGILKCELRVAGQQGEDRSGGCGRRWRPRCAALAAAFSYALNSLPFTASPSPPPPSPPPPSPPPPSPPPHSLPPPCPYHRHHHHHRLHPRRLQPRHHHAPHHQHHHRRHVTATFTAALATAALTVLEQADPRRSALEAARDEGLLTVMPSARRPL